MPTEHTRIQDGYVELGGQEEATFHVGVLYIRQDAPAMDNEETIQLSPEAQFKLLEALYQRRYALYMGTHLTFGDDVPGWIASGKAGNVTVIVDSEKPETPYPPQKPAVHIVHEGADQQVANGDTPFGLEDELP
jgi:hypothetical protein